MAILSLYIRIFIIIFLISQGSLAADFYTRIQDKCILIFETLLPFDGAETTCQKENARLWIVDNYEEYQTLTAFEEDVWIGLNKAADGKWRWVNGREFLNNTWWNPTQPGDYDHVIFKNGFLIQKSPTVPSWFICEDSYYVPSPVNMTGDISGLCGVEIMPNCDGLSCADVCRSYPNCTMYAPMANLCINIKKPTETSTCVVNLRPNVQFYGFKVKC